MPLYYCGAEVVVAAGAEEGCAFLDVFIKSCYALKSNSKSYVMCLFFVYTFTSMSQCSVYLIQWLFKMVHYGRINTRSGLNSLRMFSERVLGLGFPSLEGRVCMSEG